MKQQKMVAPDNLIANYHIPIVLPRKNMQNSIEIAVLQEHISALQKENTLLAQQLSMMELEAMESELRFVQLYKANMEGVIIFRDERLLLVNEAACNLFGFEKFELLEHQLRDLFLPEYWGDVAGRLSSNTGSTIIEPFETICRRCDGVVFPVKIGIKTLHYRGHDARAMAIQDISMNKQNEQELIENILRYRKLFEESKDAIYISGVKGRLLEVNQAFLDLFGYDRSETEGLNALRLYAHPEDRDIFTSEVEKHGSVSSYEIKLKKKDGSVIDCLLSTTTRRNMRGKIIGYQGIVRDITERVRTQELIKAKELAEQSATMKAQFLANMSHEIRTPLNAIIGMANLLHSTPLEEKQQRFLKGIQSASEHLLVLINDILDFSKIEAGKLDLESINFSPNDLLEDIEQTFRLKVKEKGLEYQTHIEQNIPLYLIGDPTRLKQIFLNLISNAIKFTDKGFIRVESKLFTEDAQTATVAFSVSDSGIGIPADKQKIIFDSFSQVSSSTTRKFGGTGLGLAITKKLVEMQGGTISLKSEKGKGSSFIFVIKFKKGSGEGVEKDKSNVFTHIKPLGEMRILLVEDNELNQVVATETIRKWGKSLDIEVCDNGKKAVARLQEKDFDIVLMDVQMPEMDGLEATQFIRKDLAMNDLPILAMTAYATSGEAERTILAGMNDYISKPFNPLQLYEKIVKLTKHQPLDEPFEIEQNTQPVARQTLSTASPDNANTLPVLDLSFLEDATGGDKELKMKLMEIILREAPDELSDMNRYCAEKNWDRLRAVAHKFKSNVTYMGIASIADTVKNIQLYAESRQHLDILPDMVVKVSEVCHKACMLLHEEYERLSKL